MLPICQHLLQTCTHFPPSPSPSRQDNISWFYQMVLHPSSQVLLLQNGIFLFSISNCLPAKASFYYNGRRLGIFSSNPGCGWFGGAGRSHTSICWNNHNTLSKRQLAQWHLLQNLNLSKGTFSCWRVTWVQVSSLWRRWTLYVTGALSPLPTQCQHWWHHPQQEWL